MKDLLYRGLLKDCNIRFSYAVTTGVANEAVLSHKCDPVVSHLLSRSLTAGVLLSPTLGEDERSTVTWNYPGPIGKIVVDFGAGADVRGMTRAKSLMDEVSSEADVYGDTGSVQVMRFNSKNLLSNGTCDAPIMDAVADLSYFYSVSEQLETDMYIAVGFNPDPENPVALCQGIMLQAMPDCDYEVLERIRKTLNSEEFKHLINEPVNSVESLLEKLLISEEQKPDFEFYPCPEPHFNCTCSREKTMNVLTTLGPEDVKDIMAKGENVNVACHFCSKVYSFTPEEVKTTAG
ncbi:MAG: Hsp33 family molecular chaperone HslO [Lentisphaeraceae bacterium]|nr:Hsp33 family molecular chaperone HslO [Lentisphaeraceae bacterium]